MSVETAPFWPTEVWLASSYRDENLPPAILDARQELNFGDSRQLIADLHFKVEQDDNGVVLAVFNGEQPDQHSKTDTIVHFNPFANGATPNMLVRSEFIRLVADKAGVRDDAGDKLPVIMLASPGRAPSSPRTDLSIDWLDQKELQRGNLLPIVTEYLKTVRQRNFGRVALLGFSQGGDMAVAAAAYSARSNLDVTSFAAGDPVAITKRSRLKLASDFMKLVV